MLKLFLLKKVVGDGQETVSLITFRLRISSEFRICFWGIMYAIYNNFLYGGCLSIKGGRVLAIVIY